MTYVYMHFFAFSKARFYLIGFLTMNERGSQTLKTFFAYFWKRGGPLIQHLSTCFLQNWSRETLLILCIFFLLSSDLVIFLLYLVCIKNWLMVVVLCQVENQKCRSRCENTAVFSPHRSQISSKEEKKRFAFLKTFIIFV